MNDSLTTESRPLAATAQPCVRLGALLIVAALCVSAAAKETLVKDVAEFDAAVKTTGPYDEIVLADGEWRDADLVFRGKGESTDRLKVLRAQTPGKVVLTGKSRLRIGGEYLMVHGLLWTDTDAVDQVISFRIDSKQPAVGCRVSECAILGDDQAVERKWVSLYGRINTVDACRFEGKRSAGTMLVVWVDDQRNGHQVCKNFFGPRPRLGKNGGETVRIGTSDVSKQHSGTYLWDNYFYHCDGEAEIISNKTCGNQYSRNVFVGCSGALTLRHGDYCVVRENLFFGDGRKGTGGVRILGDRHLVSYNVFHELTGNDTRAGICMMNSIPMSPPNGYTQVRDVTISHNSFYDCRESFVIGNADEDCPEQTSPPENCEFFENIVYTRNRPAFIVKSPPRSMQYSENVFGGGDLGLADDKGWRRADLTNIDVVEALKDSITALRNSPLKPSDTGPAWMKPGDEFLPKVLKSAKKTDAKN